MNRIEEKAHPYADEIPQMEICDTEAVTPGQQKSDSITTHNDSQGSHQCRRDEMFVFSDKVKIKIRFMVYGFSEGKNTKKTYLCHMLTEFIRYLSAERRYSPLTVRNYKHDVGQFLAWLDFDEARSDPRSITADQVREWIIHRTEEGKIGAASMNREVSSLRALWHYLRRQGIVTQDIFRSVRSLRTPRRLPVFVPESRMAYVIADINGARGGRK